MLPNFLKVSHIPGARNTVLALVLAIMPSLAVGQSYDRVDVGAFDPTAWNGIVFLAQAFHQPSGFAMRIGSLSAKSGGNFVEGMSVDSNIGEVGPHAPDGSYCRMSWKNAPRAALITLEWSRINATTVVGRLSAKAGFRLVLETYFPSQSGGSTSGSFSVDPAAGAILGERFFNQVFGAESRFVLMADQPLVGSGTYQSLEHLAENVRSTQKLVNSLADEPNAEAAGLEFNGGDSEAIHFVAEIGWNSDRLLNDAKSLLTAGKIDSILTEKAAAYESKRPSITGMFGGAPTAIGNSIFWNTLYAPSSDLIFPSDSRIDANQWGGWIVGEWDFFSTFLTSIEDVNETEAYLKAILLSQTSTGMIPNMTSAGATTTDRSNPPVGAFTVWKAYERWHNRDFLKWAYPRLKKFHEWWFADRGDGQPFRDGNRDGLLEWGSDRGSSPTVGGRGMLQAARWESGMDDSPMWDDATYDAHTYTMTQNDVGLNSLYAADAECLAKIATILGKDDEAQHFSAEYAHIKQLVQRELWNPADGIYENRLWNGSFSKRLSPTNFYPMFAGIATPEQAEIMVKRHLQNPSEFWGRYVFPSIARNDRSFDDQFYWRGNIWGATNYLVYLGLNRYHFDQISFDVAQKSYDLFMGDWNQNQNYDEQYSASGGGGGGETHYMWSSVLLLMSLEQYMDSDYWGGLRFGALAPATTGTLRNVTWEGKQYDISIGPNLTSFSRDGKPRFQADSGIVVRDYTLSDSSLSFKVHASREVNISIQEFETGTFSISIDRREKAHESVREGELNLAVPAGEHEVYLHK